MATIQVPGEPSLCSRKADLGRADRSFAVTPSTGGEGKSTTSSNLAIARSDAGARFLLVDADLRRPKIANYMNIEGAVGLTDVLIGRAELADVIQPWGRGQLFVLPAGHIPPNPSELLGSAGMAKLIQEFNRTFDVVIVASLRSRRPAVCIPRRIHPLSTTSTTLTSSRRPCTPAWLPLSMTRSRRSRRPWPPPCGGTDMCRFRRAAPRDSSRRRV